jgi:3-oxoacyl-[acyl-carrier protein] reductase
VALDAWGRLDGALVSVGGPPGSNALEATDEQWRSAFESVFLGAVRLARAVAPHLAEGGALGFVLSTSVKEPLGGLEISNGLRPGLAVWIKQVADELGPRGVRAFGLLPGGVLTDRLLSTLPDPGDHQAAARSIPLRRFGNPEEFGRVAAFVLSPAASYLTGLVVPVDGGLLRSL